MGKRGRGPKKPGIKKNKKEKPAVENNVAKAKDFETNIPKKNLYQKYWKLFWAIFVGVGVIFTMIKNWPDVVASASSNSTNFHKATTIQGTLNGTLIDDSFEWNVETPMAFYSDPVDSGYPTIRGVHIPEYDNPEFVKSGQITIKIGGIIVSTKAKVFLHPQDFLRFAFKTCNITKSLFIGVKDSRMYVSTDFKDLQHEDAMGVIEYNHWKLYKGNLLDYYDTDSSLEVKDKQGYIAFSIKYFAQPYKQNAVLEITGYLIDPNSILIMGNQITVVDSIGGLLYTDSAHQCFSKDQPDWKRKAETEIAKIQTIRK